MPSAGGRGGVKVSPTTVTVNLAPEQKVEGRLIRIDDFIVTLADSEGIQHTFRRDGERPLVEIHDPMKPHAIFCPNTQIKKSTI